MFAMAWFRPPVAAAVLLATFAIEQSFQSRDSYFFIHGTLTNYMTAALVGFALFSRFIRGEYTLFPFTREYALFLALFGYLYLSATWSLNPSANVGRNMAYLPSLVAFGVCLPLLITTTQDIRTMFRALLVMATVLVPFMLFFVRWDGRSMVLSQGAAIGSLIADTGNPLAIASFAGWITMIALTIYNRPGPSWLFFEIARWTMVIMGTLLCLKTASRGQAVAIIVAGGLFMILSRRMKSVGQAIGLLVLIGIFAVLANFAVEYAKSVDATRWKVEGFWDAWTGSRVNYAGLLLAEWADKGPVAWIFGLGGGSSYQVSGLNFYCHLVMAEALGETGFIGLFLLWLVPIFFALNYRQLFVRFKDLPVERGLIAGIGAIFLFEVILSFKQGSLLGSEIAVAFSVMLGRVLTVIQREEAQLEAMDQSYYDEMAIEEMLEEAPEEYTEDQYSDEYELASR
jgi:hypothetical protein